MNNDKELLELAAKAAGIKQHSDCGCGHLFLVNGAYITWNPLRSNPSSHRSRSSRTWKGNEMNQRILELARKAGVRDDEFRFEFPEPRYLERFYQLAHQDGQKQMRERAAKAASSQEIDGSDWIAETIRDLEITNE